MKIKYIDKAFHDKTERIIAQANEIIEEYQADGYSLTLRQLYYQFVARDLLANKQRNYNRLGSIIADARMAGLIDWNAIEDRGRNLKGFTHMDGPEEALRMARLRYRINLWENQNSHVEVWIEKEALLGVISRPCNKWDVDYFACKGYVSASEMWKAAQRLGEIHYFEQRKPIVLHLGDHDPSGIDMTRDIELRLNELAVEPRHRPTEDDDWTDPDWINYNRENVWPIRVKRIGLSMEQIRQYEPPPNPAKVTDSRYESYLKEYGKSSWELDALNPKVLSDLVEDEIKNIVQLEKFKARKSKMEKERSQLNLIGQHFTEVADFVENLNDEED